MRFIRPLSRLIGEDQGEESTCCDSEISISRDFYSVAGFGELKVLDKFDSRLEVLDQGFGRGHAYRDHL